jgi:hypothetical protein
MQLDFRKKEALLDFLDKKVFDPVLEAIPEQYSSEYDQKMLFVVQEKVKGERKFFHSTVLTALEIKNQYFRELYFEGKGETGKVLEDLELPRFLQLREQFVDLCKGLKL